MFFFFAGQVILSAFATRSICMRPTSREVFFSFVSTCQIPPRKEAFIECS